MSRESVSIRYTNFHPTEATQDFISQILNEVHHELPGGATVKASFTAKDDVIKGVLNVGSFAGPFFAVAASNNLNEVALKLMSQMRRRIEKFKSKHHARESLRHFHYSA